MTSSPGDMDTELGIHVKSQRWIFARLFFKKEEEAQDIKENNMLEMKHGGADEWWFALA